MSITLKLDLTNRILPTVLYAYFRILYPLYFTPVDK